MSTLTAMVLVPLLLAVIWFDLRETRIPNALTAAFAATAAGSVLLHGLPADAPLRLAAAAVVFAAGFAAFAARRLGGGDVKLLAVLMLLIPSPGLAVFALLLSGSLIASLAAIRLLRAAAPAGLGGWRGLSASARLPLGPGIALASLLFLALLHGGGALS